MLPKIKSQNKFLCLFFTILKLWFVYIFPVSSSISLHLSFKTHKIYPFTKHFCSQVTKSLTFHNQDTYVHWSNLIFTHYSSHCLEFRAEEIIHSLSTVSGLARGRQSNPSRREPRHGAQGSPPPQSHSRQGIKTEPYCPILLPCLEWLRRGEVPRTP